MDMPIEHNEVQEAEVMGSLPAPVLVTAIFVGWAVTIAIAFALGGAFGSPTFTSSCPAYLAE